MKAQVHISYSGDCGAIHTLQSLAMDAVDGVNVRSNYSYVMIQDINYSREFHMYFPWGQQQKCHMAMENLYCRSIFQIGYIFDYALESLKPVHTNRMHSEGFAVTLFDESFNASTTLSHAALNAFYQVFFDMLEEHACLRVYVKSKLYGRDALAGLFPGLIAAEATRRLTVFPNTLLPCQASVEANLVVCCGLNTAGIEAALLGKPVVFLLHDKGRCPQFERLGQGRVVYHGLEAFRQDLREILVHGRWPQGLGDIGQALEELDPFRDGDSGARMGSVLAKFMEEIRAGADGREALRSCVEAYRAAHGDRALLDESPDLWPDRS